MTDWTPADTDSQARIDRIMDDARERPETADVEYDDRMITITFEDRTTLPEGFDEWADANGLSVRDFTVVPETDGFVVDLALVDELDELSPFHEVGDGPFHRFGDPSPRGRGFWTAGHGRFGHPHAGGIHDWGLRPHGGRLHAACNRLRRTLGDDESSRFPFGPGGPRGSGSGRSE